MNPFLWHGKLKRWIDDWLYLGEPMGYHNQEELKALIAAKLSIEEILDILGWEMTDLVESLSDEIDLYAEEFEDAVAD